MQPREWYAMEADSGGENRGEQTTPVALRRIVASWKRVAEYWHQRARGSWHYKETVDPNG